MAIIDWQSGKYTKGIKLTADAERDQELLIGILKLGDTGTKWKGKIKYHKYEAINKYSIELRKFLKNGTSALLVLDNENNLRLSANGTMQFTIDQYSEMNLVVLEAQNVLSNLNKTSSVI